MEDHISVLLRIYDNLKKSFYRSTNDKIGKSLFLEFLNLKSKTKRMRLLMDAAILSHSINPDLLDKLINLNYVDLIEMRKKVTLTSRGIWRAEEELKLIEYADLLNYIESKWFNCFADTKRVLAEKEKVILFTAIAVRAFSEESAVNLNKGELVHAGWKKAIELVCNFLNENNVIKSNNVHESLFAGRNNKPSLRPVIHAFRYSENLPKLTNGIYIAKNLQYYLDLYKDHNINSSNLIFLFKLIFGDTIDYDLKNKIEDFCERTSYEISVQVFSIDQHIFASPDYDKLLRDSLRSLVLSPTLKG